MSVFTYAARIYKQFTPRQYIALGVIILALVAMLALGFTIGRNSAAAIRDCGETQGGMNSIANNKDSGGGCGALSSEELITDIHNGDPDDQAGIFAHFGLPAGKYNEFKSEAKMGLAKMNGDIVVDNQVVMEDAWSIGRVKFDYSSEYPIDDVGNYFKSAHTDVLKSEIPVMVLFDDNGMVETAVLTSCGNPVKGKNVKWAAECKKLHKTPVAGKENTYAFTTEASTSGPARIHKVEYFANGEKFGEETDLGKPVTKTFTESATVVAKVTVLLPGDKKKVIESELCKQMIEVKKKEVSQQPEKPKEQPKPQPKVLPAKVEQPLPAAGPADAAGIFFGTSLAGAVGHRLYIAYRNHKQLKK